MPTVPTQPGFLVRSHLNIEVGGVALAMLPTRQRCTMSAAQTMISMEVTAANASGAASVAVPMFSIVWHKATTRIEAEPSTNQVSTIEPAASPTRNPGTIKGWKPRIPVSSQKRGACQIAQGMATMRLVPSGYRRAIPPITSARS